MLRHKNGCQATCQEQLDDLAVKYFLNEHAKEMLGLGPKLLEPVLDDIPTYEDRRRTTSDSLSNSDVEDGDFLALQDVSGDADIDYKSWKSTHLTILSF